MPLNPSKRAVRRRWPLIAAALLVLIAALTIGEWRGWPLLAGPVQRQLSAIFDRPVRLSAGKGTDALRVRFIWRLRLSTPELEIAAPPWSTAPHLALARDVVLELGYADLWHTYRGQPLRVRRLEAAWLDAHLLRLADGRASWQLGPPTVPARPVQPLRFDQLRVTTGIVSYDDVLLKVKSEARMSWGDDRLRLVASGHYLEHPLKVDLTAAGLLPLVADEVHAEPLSVRLNASVGRAALAFDGSAADVLHLSALSGRFRLAGPSLAAVGDPLGVTLPTTAAFQTEGRVVKQGLLWRVVVDHAAIGASRLRGAFTYTRGPGVPVLAGRLTGTRLLLVDLGPVVGTTPAVAALRAPQAPAPIPVALPKSTRGPDKVLPDRPFDLAALRAMDANVLIDVAEVDLNTRFVEPLHPLRTHLQLTAGVLRLDHIDARTGDGSLRGDMTLDGRADLAQWAADLRWDGVRLERWLHLARSDGKPPFITGNMNGSATLKGQGRSTAQILGSLQGRTRNALQGGSVSHLAIEVAGLDIAQSLGLLVKGDDALPVQCGVADLVAQGGVFRPVVMVVDTRDSTVWLDGSLSLATEALDLRAMVAPKDFSPLTLRTPLRVRGTFAKPEVSIDKGAVGRKVALSGLLALLNPLAALIPLIDAGDNPAAEHNAAGCRALMQRPKAPRSVAGR
ncbi:MAG: AsmA family protein [Burkholderiales bacterium]|nr:AsmA family protein [Burkholderiales bacterium]